MKRSAFVPSWLRICQVLTSPKERSRNLMKILLVYKLGHHLETLLLWLLPSRLY